ncbi:chromosomal replication initiator protein DnaA [Rubellimicrobium sp. CFH 75288]|nr:chromosomal replication initiator protein DnaA [Rubellimicrobium sp. CFH 75288]
MAGIGAGFGSGASPARGGPTGRPPEGGDAAAAWARASAVLRDRVGAGSFRSWIAPLSLEGVENGVAVLRAPTAFLGSYALRAFGEHILAALAAAGWPAQRLEMALADRPAAPPRAAAPAAADASRTLPPRPAPEEEGTRLDPRLTFERFAVGAPNELAHAAARRLAEGRAAFNPLFLHGGVGQGKTHLLQAVAQALRAREPGARVLYLSAEQFMVRFVSALRERRMVEFKAWIRSLDMLLVDDVQFLAGKDSTQEEFFHSFNALFDQGRRIVLSADRPPAEIPHLEERVASRLQAGLVVGMGPADEALRLAVLRLKLAQAQEADPQLRIADGVLEFLAARITANLRVLEGALTRLIAQAQLVQREVTPDLAREGLADLLRAAERRVSVEEIQRRVAEHYGIRLADLVGPRRLRPLARPRQVAMYLAKTLTSRSLPDIGRRFGGRDHTTVLHGVRRIEALIAEDQTLAGDVAQLRRAIERQG